MKSFFLKLSGVSLIIVLAAGLYLYASYDKFLKAPVFKTSETRLEIKPGSSYTAFVRQIKSADGQGQLWQWQLMGRWHGFQHRLKSGEYVFTGQDTPRSLLEGIANNQVISYEFTIVEGQTWQQIRSQLPLLKVNNHLLTDKSDREIMTTLAIKEASMEGQLLPETYRYTRTDSDLTILKRAHQALLETLEQAWANRQSGLAINSPYELLIMASIIEKETAVSDERNTVSGVFNRRLQKNMRLQTDPTVIYGVGEAYQGDITYKHLRTDTPFNTYTRHGLPPTPIAMAGSEAIKAAGQPNKGSELFFVANGAGGHTFTNTYQAHQQAVKAYLKGRSQ